MNPRQKRVEILVVGNEILNGTTLDTNSFWLSKRLNEIGLRVQRKTTVRDDMSSISQAFRDSIARKPNWIISVGGLGPTFDDLTSQGLSRAVRKKWKPDTRAVKMLEVSYARRGRTFRSGGHSVIGARLKMATLPEGAEPLQNPVGSAPGILLNHANAKIICLPGVPREMKGIFIKELLPMMERDSKFFTSEEWINAIGVSESRLAPVVSQVFRKYGSDIYVKSHPQGFKEGSPVVSLQVTLNVPEAEKTAGERRLKSALRSLRTGARNLGAELSSTDSIR